MNMKDSVGMAYPMEKADKNELTGPFTRVILWTVKDTATESYFYLMVEYIMVNLRIIIWKDMEIKSEPMKTNTKEIG